MGFFDGVSVGVKLGSVWEGVSEGSSELGSACSISRLTCW